MKMGAFRAKAQRESKERKALPRSQVFFAALPSVCACANADF
jgi:hypothetical protein